MGEQGKKAASDPLVPAKTPFGYNVGVNYESWEVGRTGYSIAADLDQIHENFRLIRTYHDAGFAETPVIDGTQAQVIDWIVAHPGTELVMGTNNSALAQGGFGSPWSAGLMTTKTYTDAWVDMLIDAFGSVAKVKAGLRAILLGNEVDANGPPPGDPDFDTYVNTWIPKAFDNLKASLAAKGLGSIAISTTIANYGATNEVSVKIPAHIIANWGSGWNNGEPFVLFNQYTPDNQTSTDFKAVETYFDSVAAAFGSSLEVFIGETGYSTDAVTPGGAANQATVYTEIFTWLTGQKSSGGKTVPLFFFDAFDRPAYPTGQIGFGVYGEDSSSQPTGLKPGLATIFPAWTTKAVTSATKHSESLYGDRSHDVIRAKAGDDIVLGLGGGDKLFGQGGFDLIMGNGGRDHLKGGKGMDMLDGGRGKDLLDGGGGDDTMRGGKGRDTFVLSDDGSIDTVVDFRDGIDRFALSGGLKTGGLAFEQAGADTEIRYHGEVLAVILATDKGQFDKGDFFHF
ncbi:MAG: hypothetical protein KDK07_18510 [Bauldia sp.]|nr:hypothetical protein [Bauldia sp.]